MSILDYTTRHRYEIVLRRVSPHRFDVSPQRFNVFLDVQRFGHIDEVDHRWVFYNFDGVRVRDNDTLSGLLGWIDLVIDAHGGDEDARRLCEISAGSRPGDRIWPPVEKARP